jgi:hypothetical protein
MLNRTTIAASPHLCRRPRLVYGRDWPKDLDPTFTGYSIGKWIDEDGDGRFDMPTNLASNAYFCACGK